MKRLYAPVLAGLLVLAAVPVMGSDQETPVDPVYIDSTQILYMESWPVQVALEVTGDLPTPCHEAKWEVEDDGDVVTVTLWSEADPEMACVTVLEPVWLSIPLGAYETADLPVLLNSEPVGVIQVGETGRAPAVLSGAGWSFGMCMGYCRADLEIKDDQLTLTGSDQMGAEVLFDNEGWLTPAGAAALANALLGVDAGVLEETYGCPDCADGGAAYLQLGQGGVTSSHSMGFGAPPTELEAAYELSQALMSALESCRSSKLVTAAETCTPYDAS